jgi:hypothetical protein
MSLPVNGVSNNVNAWAGAAACSETTEKKQRFGPEG